MSLTFYFDIGALHFCQFQEIRHLFCFLAGEFLFSFSSSYSVFLCIRLLRFVYCLKMRSQTWLTYFFLIKITICIFCFLFILHFLLFFLFFYFFYKNCLFLRFFSKGDISQITFFLQTSLYFVRFAFDVFVFFCYLWFCFFVCKNVEFCVDRTRAFLELCRVSWISGLLSSEMYIWLLLLLTVIAKQMSIGYDYEVVSGEWAKEIESESEKTSIQWYRWLGELQVYRE